MFNKAFYIFTKYPMTKVYKYYSILKVFSCILSLTEISMKQASSKAPLTFMQRFVVDINILNFYPIFIILCHIVWPQNTNFYFILFIWKSQKLLQLHYWYWPAWNETVLNQDCLQLCLPKDRASEFELHVGLLKWNLK